MKTRDPAAGTPPETAFDHDDAALLALLRHLDATGYAFVTPTPATHARVLARRGGGFARSTRDVLGWSMKFRPGTIDPEIERLLGAAGMLRPAAAEDGGLVSAVRVSRLADRLFLHSAYPTTDKDAVFFGPDSYRFADLIQAELPRWQRTARPRIVDVGSGSGVGAVVAATIVDDADLCMTDVNGEALRFARINAAAAGVKIAPYRRGDLDGLGAIDVAIANPPYIIDDAGRAYRDGGDMHGGRVSLDMARMALARLSPGGRIILYTGSAIVDGADPLAAALADAAREHGCTLRYREIDPDVFGEEIDNDAYRDVERIALVAAIIDRPDRRGPG